MIYSIEGNIGCGKTTMLNHLKEHFKYNNNIVFLTEPVDEWESIKDSDGKNMLEKFYADPDKYAFSFQIMSFTSILNILKKTIKNKPNSIIICERSLLSTKNIFAKMLYDSGKIKDVEYEIYCNLFNMFSSEYIDNKIIYINSDPKVCFDRINIRSRKGENNIPIEYLNNCNKYHNNMIDIIEDKNKLIIDGNININENNNIYFDRILEIKLFINNTINNNTLLME
jgi:deoxyadenosine/deoxycytidine kinase